MWLKSKKQQRRDRLQRRRTLRAIVRPEALESRLLLSITVDNQTYVAMAGSTLTVNAANGVLNGATGGTPPYTAHVTTGPLHDSSFTLNSDGSLSYTPGSGLLGTAADSFHFNATDNYFGSSNQGTATINVEYSVTSAVNETKPPVDVVGVSRQIIGGAGGQSTNEIPAGVDDLALEYNQTAAHPTPTIEGNFTTSLPTAPTNTETVTATLTFNGVAQSPVYYSLSSVNGSDSTIHVAIPFDASSLATGCYAYSLSINSPNMSAPSTISGTLNVVNDAAGSAGAGWDIPGVMHLYSNSATGVAAGVLLTPGDGNGWYFTQGSGSSYTSPAGPYGYSTLTSVTGGWQLVDQFGTTYNFNSSGYETSEVARTGLTNTYNWSSGLLTSIDDTFSRSVSLGYTSGLLSSITDMAGNVTTIAHSGADLTSITLPNPGGGAPEWQYAYSTGHYLTGVTDPMGAVTTYTLSSGHAISGTALPGGASTSAAGEQGMGFGGSSSTGAPGAMLDTSVVPTTTDADSNTSDYQTDVFGNLISFTNAAGKTTTWARNSNGQVTTLTQPAPTTGGTQPVTTYSYDSLGNETSASGALSTFGTYTYNSFSEPTEFENSLGDTWTWSYDSYGNLTSQTDALGNTISYTVDSYGNRLTMTQPKPNDASGTITTDYAYDTKERLVTITFPDSSTETYTYTTDDQVASVTDENSHTTLHSHDVLGRLTGVEDALSNTVSYTYDKDNDLLTTTDQLGNVTTDAYNSRNELTSVTLPVPATGVSAPVWTYTYNANGQELTQEDPLGNTTTWAYTNLGQVSSVTLPVPATGISAPVTTVTYDNLGREVTSTNSLSGVTTTAYNSNNWVTSVTAPNPGGGAPETQYGYNSIGEQTTITDPMGHVQTIAYTNGGQVASVTDNLSHETIYTYGHDGELLTTTDALSHTTSNTYNNRFWITSTTDANSGTTSYGFDAHGNRTSLTDSVGNEDQYTYSATNQVLTDTNQLGYAISYVYNASGDLTQETDRNGLVRDFTYDNLHRETAEKWMSGGTAIYTIAYAYNADNAITSASDPDSSYAYTYDHLGRVTSLDNSSTPNIPHVVLASQYDAMGDRTQLTATVAGTADFLNAYTYDADQNLLQATQEGQTGGNGVAPKGVGYAYNLDGQITSVLNFDPTTSSPHPDIALGTLSYDSGNRLTEIDYTHSGSTLDELSWSYDAANLVTSFSSSADSSTASYSYDPTNQLTAGTYTGTNQPANESYSFDSTGNRTNTGYSTATNNQLTSDGTFNYTYDHEGNRVTRTRISSATASDYETTYTWDYRERLTDVNYYNNSSVLTKHIHYVYDVYDHLIGTEIDATGSGSYGSSEWYALDITADPIAPSEPVLQFNGSGNETYRFLNGPSASGVEAVMAHEGITTQGSAGTADYLLADDLGSVRDIVNTSSTVVDHIVYNSFGQVAYESNSAIAHWAGFAGYHTDANTGLDYADHRWYDPKVGRWISEDPLGFSGGDTNVTRYVGNNLATAIDPWGLATVSVGINFTFTFIFINLNASINLNVGPNGTSVGPTLSAGPALGGGLGVGPQVTVTSAPSVQSLNGFSMQAGGYVEAFFGAGLAYVMGSGYGGLCGSASAGGGAALYWNFQYSWAWWYSSGTTWSSDDNGATSGGSTTSNQTNGPNSGNGGQYLNQGQ